MEIVDENTGRQGVISHVIFGGNPAVAKKSNDINFVIEFEYEILQTLEQLHSLHFVKPLTTIPFFNQESERLLIMQKICYDNGRIDTLANAVVFKKKPLRCFESCLHQTLGAILMYEQLRITHYDLHSDNVMITNTPYDIHVYITPGGKQIPIKTFGLAPVIIDFGLGFQPKSTLKTTCSFTSKGYTPFITDPLVDCRIFLYSLLEDFRDSQKRYKFNKQDKEWVNKFASQIKLFFGNLENVSKQGWFEDNTFESVYDKIQSDIPFKPSGIFKSNHFHWLLGMIHSLIPLPLVLKEDDPTEEVALTRFRECFIKLNIEWVKVEQIIRNTREEKKFFKVILLQMQNNTKNFKKFPADTIKNLLSEISNIFRVILFHEKERIDTQKKLLYSKLSVFDTESIWEKITKPQCSFKKGQKVLVVDIKKGKNFSFEISTDDVNEKVFFDITKE